MMTQYAPYDYRSGSDRANGTPDKRRSERARIQVAYRTWNRNNLLSVSAGIEKRGEVWTDSVFFRMHKGYDQGHYIAMQMDCLDMRALSHACKEAVFSGASDWKKFTDPAKNGGEGGVKSLGVAIDKNGSAHINLQQGEVRLNAIFSKQELLAFADQVETMAQMTEKALYSVQRKGMGEGVT